MNKTENKSTRAKSRNLARTTYIALCRLRGPPSRTAGRWRASVVLTDAASFGSPSTAICASTARGNCCFPYRSSSNNAGCYTPSRGIESGGRRQWLDWSGHINVRYQHGTRQSKWWLRESPVGWSAVTSNQIDSCSRRDVGPEQENGGW